VDALGKLMQMLQVPPQVLWERIPGVTQQDVKRWLAAAAQADPMAQLNAMVERQMNGLPAVDTVPAEQEEPAELAGVTGDDTA